MLKKAFLMMLVVGWAQAAMGQESEIYYCRQSVQNKSEIVKVGADGSNETVVVTQEEAIQVLNDIYGATNDAIMCENVHVDSIGQRLYWAARIELDPTTPRSVIVTANLDGTGHSGA